MGYAQYVSAKPHKAREFVRRVCGTMLALLARPFEPPCKERTNDAIKMAALCHSDVNNVGKLS